MNCKPGDLAIVVGGPLRNGTEMGREIGAITLKMILGRVVRVVSLNDAGAWLLEEPIPLGTIRGTLRDGRRFTADDVQVTHLGDDLLRPLPPLNEDDELLTERPRDEVAA